MVGDATVVVVAGSVVVAGVVVVDGSIDVVVFPVVEVLVGKVLLVVWTVVEGEDGIDGVEVVVELVVGSRVDVVGLVIVVVVCGETTA